MNLVRRYKISKTLTKPLSNVDNEIINFIKLKISNLIKYQDEGYPDSIFYLSLEGEWILEFYELENQKYYLFIRYEEFWEYLHCKYSMVDKDIQDILQYLVGLNFDYNIDTTWKKISYDSMWVEHTFKSNNQKLK
jgi:hypothetical protein